MSKRILHTGKWLAFGEVDVCNKDGQTHTWEYITRTGTTEGAVCIIAIKRTTPLSIVLVKQFRPPIGAQILELPAGLVEKGQTQEDAALRELREETGYTGDVVSKGPPIYNTPGMTDEYVATVTIEVGEQFEQATEPSEEIEVVELPIEGLKATLLQHEADGIRIDAKLWSLAEGLDLNQRLFGA